MTDTKIHMDKILLIGDTIIDINTEGTLLGTSAETPTLVISKDTVDDVVQLKILTLLDSQRLKIESKIREETISGQ